MEEADDHARDLRFFGGREGRYDQVRCDFHFLVWVNLIHQAAAFDRAGRLMFRAFDDFRVGLYERIAFNIRLVMRDREDVLEVAGVFFHVDLVGSRKGNFFVAVTNPCLLAFLAVSGDDAHVLAGEWFTFD